MSIPSHAQNRHYRRIANRFVSIMRGKLIPGELTLTEIEHKSRRRDRRIAKFTEDVKCLPERIRFAENELTMLGKFEPADQAENDACKRRIHATSQEIVSLRNHLSRAQVSLQKLNGN